MLYIDVIIHNIKKLVYIFSSFMIAIFLILINFFEALNRTKHFSRQRFSSRHRRRDMSLPCAVVGTPSSTKAGSEKEELAAFTFPSCSPQFFSDRPLLLPSSHPLRAAFSRSTFSQQRFSAFDICDLNF